MIELQDVHKTYDTGTIALNGISMKIDDGEFVFLVGPSGSGKSTIIKILTAELRPTSGSALVNGFAVEKLRSRAVPYLRRTLGVIFQDFRLIGDKSVYENVAFAMRVIGAPEKEIRKRVPYVLELVGLENKGRRLPQELSGGEPETTNNRMELTAVIRSLALLKEPCIVELYSDSKYVIDALEKGWVWGWKKRGWVKSDKKPALNVDLWEQLLPLIQTHQVHYHWVKGHASNEKNNRCDQLAVAESKRF